VRINAACKDNGIIYSRMIRGLKEAKVTLDRKMLSEIALNDPKTFTQIVQIADKALPATITRMKKN
jgi:large subunit ribosomal protein L20